MIVVACDPDCATPAFAIFNGQRLLKWELLKTARHSSLEILFPSIRAIAERWRPEMLVIENQYLPSGKDAPYRFRSISQLVAARGMITALFLVYCNGMQYRIIEPLTWQQSIGGSKLGREQLKRRSILKASDIARERIDDHNVADAINIGYWFVTKNRITGKAMECAR